MERADRDEGVSAIEALLANAGLLVAAPPSSDSEEDAGTPGVPL